MWKNTESFVKEILGKAGIYINGNQPWDLQVHDNRFYDRLLAQGDLGLGESYMDGWWDCEHIDEMVAKALNARIIGEVIRNNSFNFYVEALKARVFNRQNRLRSFEVGEAHYDLGNDLFQLTLDDRMVYSCAYWKGASSLEDAQRNKLDLICKKLQLRPGMRVLEIGCGWGSFMKFAVENYGVTCTGITVSKQQVELGKLLCEGLPVEFLLQDYRDVEGEFDAVVSIAMFEAVGYKNHSTFMQIVHRCLKGNGLFLLHTIGGNCSINYAGQWINKYIFPNGVNPSIAQIGRAIENLFVMEDWHNFGSDYDRTLLQWYENFNTNWVKLKDKYGERFYRMWTFYLLTCAGFFRARDLQLWQILMSKHGVPGGVEYIR